MYDDFWTKNGQGDVVDILDRKYSFNLAALNEEQVLSGNDEGILDFFIVGVFGWKVVNGGNNREDILLGRKFLVNDPDEFLAGFLIHV